MTQDTITLRSTIHPDLKRSMLFKGSAIAIIGFLPLLYAGIMVPAEHLQFWGFPLFLLSFAMIAAGLIPYRKICKLEEQPNEIILSQDSLQYYENKKLLFTIPLSNIDSIQNIEEGKRYGIGMQLKNSENKIILHQPIEIAKIRKKMQKTYGVDLFFPYFSHRSYQELDSCLSTVPIGTK